MVEGAHEPGATTHRLPVERTRTDQPRQDGRGSRPQPPLQHFFFLRHDAYGIDVSVSVRGFQNEISSQLPRSNLLAYSRRALPPLPRYLVQVVPRLIAVRHDDHRERSIHLLKLRRESNELGPVHEYRI